MTHGQNVEVVQMGLLQQLFEDLIADWQNVEYASHGFHMLSSPGPRKYCS